MKSVNKYSQNERNPISFLDNIFYWIWSSVPSNGFPDRTFVAITVCQFSYILLIVSALLTLLDDKFQLLLYYKSEYIIIPMFILLIVLFLVNFRIFNEKKYLFLASCYKLMPTMEKKKNKDVFHAFILVTILVIIIDIVLLWDYNSHINSLIKK